MVPCSISFLSIRRRIIAKAEIQPSLVRFSNTEESAETEVAAASPLVEAKV